FIIGNQKIRLAQVDAPEMGTPYGIESKKMAENLILNEKVSLKVVGVDKYNRKIAFVYINGHSLGFLMVKSGYARQFKRYSKSKKLARAEATAKMQKRGIWRSL